MSSYPKLSLHTANFKGWRASGRESRGLSCSLWSDIWLNEPSAFWGATSRSHFLPWMNYKGYFHLGQQARKEPAQFGKYRAIVSAQLFSPCIVKFNVILAGLCTEVVKFKWMKHHIHVWSLQQVFRLDAGHTKHLSLTSNLEPGFVLRKEKFVVLTAPHQ